MIVLSIAYLGIGIFLFFVVMFLAVRDAKLGQTHAQIVIQRLKSGNIFSILESLGCILFWPIGITFFLYMKFHSHLNRKKVPGYVKFFQELNKSQENS